MTDSSVNKIASNNFKIIKKMLTEPYKFRELDYHQKACFSQNYEKYGFVETWDIALNLLNNLPNNENIFNELIMETSKVKPYLDVEWLRDSFPTYKPDNVKMKIKRCLVYIFKKEFEYNLDTSNIYFTKCHRDTSKGYKYSFHVIISTHNPMIVFEKTNSAKFLAVKMKNVINKYINDKYELVDSEKDEFIEYKFDDSIIDQGVYGKTQRIRLPGHCKKEDFFSPMIIEGESTNDPLEYIITNIDQNNKILDAQEQRDYLYRDIKNFTKIDFMDSPDEQMIIFEKVKIYHPSAYLEKIDSSGFLQFNYKDRKEPCFTDENKEIFHDKIGFFAYKYNNLICVGCHSGNCSKSDNTKTDKKIIKVLGSLDRKKNLTFEKVDFNNIFDIEHFFVKDCIMNGAIGISNLFERMYLEPKRIKWINDTKIGSSYFWDGKLWQQDDYAFIERLLVSTVVKVIKNFKKDYKKNNEISNEEAEEAVEIATKMINSLNNGMNIQNILKFVKPLIRDTEFSKIKDIHPYWLSCKNGMVNLITGELRPSVPEDNITKSIETVYDENADCNDFDLFIKQITSDEQGENKDLYDFFKWCIGYALQGSPKKKMFLILYGPHGFNGKSLVMNTIKEVLEQYAVSMDSSVVLDNGSKKTAGSHSTELMQLENCRLGLLSDTKEDANIDDGRMKQLTGITDKISAREIFGKQKEFTPTFVPFISTNHPIQVNLSDQAMYERLILFPFILSFVDNPTKSYEKKGNPSLAENFKNNKEGILKWLIQASVYYNKNQNKLPPKVILEAKEKYNKQVNIYVDFIDSTFIKTNNEDNMIKRIELIDAYKVYMQHNGMFNKCKPKIAEREFDKLLKINQVKGNKCYIGIKFKDEEIMSDDELN